MALPLLGALKSMDASTCFGEELIGKAPECCYIAFNGPEKLMLEITPPGSAARRPFPLRAALATAVLACGSLTLAQAPAAPPPAPDAQQAAPTPPADGQPPAAVAPASETQHAVPAAAPAEPARTDDKSGGPSAEDLREAAATEDQLRQKLVGKTFYLRGGYLDDALHFNEKGELDGSSPKASYTLSLVQIDKVKVDKHKVELEGVRYGLHFLGALASEDQSANVDRVKLTSKKKPLKITIEREIVVIPKKKKEDKKKSDKKPASAAVQPAVAPENAAAAPLEPSRHGVTVTTSPAEAARMLGTALENIFASGIDDRMIATLPDYWKLYYKAVAEKSDYRPADASILRAAQADKKPQLTKAFEPPSNEYAQKNGVAGMAMYHVVVGPDGKPGEVAVGRPIGFGLDENAVEAIRRATFEPGSKDGKPVPVEVDLTVQFRIYSKRTAAVAGDAAKATDADKGPKLPGPYSVNLPQPQQPAPQAAPQPQ
ncbi:energy transducer TonB [Acidobacteria bacterium AB60]|nr:energy transducer TonB [Acidobacteria bacterium AB60]